MKCFNCNKNMKKATIDYRYVDSGLRNIVLKNLNIMTCSECGEEEIIIPNMEQLHQLMATVIANQEQRLLPEEIRFLRSHIGFSGINFAKAIGVTQESVSRWEKGKEQMSLPHERFLRFIILSECGPTREYHNDLFKLGIKKRTTKGKHVFVKIKARWKEAA